MAGKRTSLYPTAHVARLPGDHQGAFSAVLVPRPLGWLAVKLSFHRQPVAGIPLQFHALGASDSPGAPIGGALLTDRDGLARLDFRVPAGRYVCQISDQAPQVCSTVPNVKYPFAIPLPVGRPYVDIDEAPEYEFRACGAVDTDPEDAGRG